MKSIEHFLKKQVTGGKTPSVQYAFFNTDEVIFELSYGSKNVKRNLPVNASTTYPIFSVTKTFTAVAVLQLAQAGMIDLDKPTASYLPQFPYPGEITVRQLLSHTAGIPNPIPLKWIHLESEHDTFDRDRFFADIFSAYPKPVFPPGGNFKYSNLGYVILGQLIEKISGLTFEQYVQENIFDRCGVDAGGLGFRIDPDRHATGYHRWWSLTNLLLGVLIDTNKFMGPREGPWKPFKNFYNNGVAYGGIVGTVSGLIAYARALLDNRSLLLNDQYRQQLFTEGYIKSRPTGMSLSWFTGSLKGRRYFAHAGGGGGYYVELRLYPDHGIGSVIMYNRSGMRDERMLDKIDPFLLS